MEFNIVIELYVNYPLITQTMKTTLIAVLIIALAVLGFMYYKQDPIPTGTVPSRNGDDGVVCTMDAMQCPDGSYVGRKGPNCEFSPCPTGMKVEVNL